MSDSSTDAADGGSEFDAYSEDYEDALARGVRLSGEDSTFFARGRVAWLARCLSKVGVTPRTVLDFGCGTGSTTPFLLNLAGSERLVGTDDSRSLLAVAARDYSSKHARFVAVDELVAAHVDLAYCNGVFHHIEPELRPRAVEHVARALRPGGLFAFWENNPWNPGTRMVMSRIPFDRDATMLSAPQARRLLRSSGFEILRTDFAFVFPSPLRAFRPLEPLLAPLPLGAQYMVLALKPSGE